jgi:hypothetical protein
MLSIRNGNEIDPFPNIYHLRSSISRGITTIEWSASQCETEDCLFGIWYSLETPLDTTRQPDTTVRYYPLQTEYSTTFQQKTPVYIAIAAMRTGNEPEIGKVHELYLDWNSTPSRAPDDVIVMNPPLSPIDTNMEIMKHNDPNLTLW